MLPNFLIIGAARCGTTWMAKNLRLHPEIYMPSKKEIHFFDRDYDQGWSYYESFFPKARCASRKAIGEATPAYLYLPQVAGLIRSALPNVKIIVALRDPVERAYSHYWNLVAEALDDGVNKKLEFEEKLKLTPRLIEEGFYDERLKVYYDLFPRENICVVLFEEMVSDPETHFSNIYKFLGVSEDFRSPLLGVRINSAASKLGRSKLLDLMSKALYRIVRIPALAERIDTINAIPPPQMDPSTRRQLQQTYAQSIANLETMLDRDLSLWNR
jgi:hypothetical protein